MLTVLTTIHCSVLALCSCSLFLIFILILLICVSPPLLLLVPHFVRIGLFYYNGLGMANLYIIMLLYSLVCSALIGQNITKIIMDSISSKVYIYTWYNHEQIVQLRKRNTLTGRITSIVTNVEWHNYFNNPTPAKEMTKSFELNV